MSQPSIPRHVAIIMDGNGRWAKARGLPRVAGHRRGAEAVRNAVESAGELGVRYLTLFGFSSENWRRPVDEVSDLMGLLRHYLRSEIAEMHKKGVRVRVIAGTSHGVAGAMQREVTEPIYLDLELPAGATFTQAIPAGHNAFVYVYRGGVKIEGTDVPVQRMAILDNNGGDGVRFTAPAASRVLLIAGKPLNEPIAQYGPFVMNTNEEIFQAVQDYQNGRF